MTGDEMRDIPDVPEEERVQYVLDLLGRANEDLDQAVRCAGKWELKKLATPDQYELLRFRARHSIEPLLDNLDTRLPS